MFGFIFSTWTLNIWRLWLRDNTSMGHQEQPTKVKNNTMSTRNWTVSIGCKNKFSLLYDSKISCKQLTASGSKAYHLIHLFFIHLLILTFIHLFILSTNIIYWSQLISPWIDFMHLQPGHGSYGWTVQGSSVEPTAKWLPDLWETWLLYAFDIFLVVFYIQKLLEISYML